MITSRLQCHHLERKLCEYGFTYKNCNFTQHVISEIELFSWLNKLSGGAGRSLWCSGVVDQLEAVTRHCHLTPSLSLLLSLVDKHGFSCTRRMIIVSNTTCIRLFIIEQVPSVNATSLRWINKHMLVTSRNACKLWPNVEDGSYTRTQQTWRRRHTGGTPNGIFEAITAPQTQGRSQLSSLWGRSAALSTAVVSSVS